MLKYANQKTEFIVFERRKLNGRMMRPEQEQRIRKG